jgi:hypothetical protein
MKFRLKNKLPQAIRGHNKKPKHLGDAEARSSALIAARSFVEQ